MKVFYGVLGVVIAVLLLFGLMFINYNNKEVSLKTAIVAQQKNNEASFDTMWKILQQQAGVTNEYKNAFKEIYPDLIKGRYSGAEGKSLLAKFITESNPNFDIKLYDKLMSSIEGERKRFFNDQRKLIDLKREYDSLQQKIPSKFFVSGTQIEITVITSDKTEETFKSGKDNSVDLFLKK